MRTARHLVRPDTKKAPTAVCCSHGELTTFPHLELRNQRRNQVKILDGANWGRSPNRGREAPRIEGKARTEDEARDRVGGGVWGGARWAPQKFFENLRLKTCDLVHSLNNNLYFVASICFLYNFLIFLFNERVMVKPPKAAIYRGAEWRWGFGSGLPIQVWNNFLGVKPSRHWFQWILFT